MADLAQAAGQVKPPNKAKNWISKHPYLTALGGVGLPMGALLAHQLSGEGENPWLSVLGGLGLGGAATFGAGKKIKKKFGPQLKPDAGLDVESPNPFLKPNLEPIEAPSFTGLTPPGGSYARR